MQRKGLTKVRILGRDDNDITLKQQEILDSSRNEVYHSTALISSIQHESMDNFGMPDAEFLYLEEAISSPSSGYLRRRCLPFLAMKQLVLIKPKEYIESISIEIQEPYNDTDLRNL